MSENYIESGYVEYGYIESLNPPFFGNVPLKHFISNGTKSESELVSSIRGDLAGNARAMLYIPESKKIIIVDGSSVTEFLGGVDQDAIIDIVNNTIANADITLQASIIGSDGSTVTAAKVTQTDENSFDITVPQEIVGTEYHVRITRV